MGSSTKDKRPSRIRPTMNPVEREITRRGMVREELAAFLSKFCLLANREILDFYGTRGSCIFSTAVVCDVLNHLGIASIPLRVTAAAFRPDPHKTGCVLGSEGDGTRRLAARRDHWYGHLVSLVEEKFLMDTTLDQMNDHHPEIGATPCVIYLPGTEWNNEPGCWTGLLTMFGNGSTLRYSKFHRQNGWKSAGDFRPRRRREIVQSLLGMAQMLMEFPEIELAYSPMEEETAA
jgi:hypothetical protein